MKGFLGSETSKGTEPVVVRKELGVCRGWVGASMAEGGGCTGERRWGLGAGLGEIRSGHEGCASAWSFNLRIQESDAIDFCGALRRS